MSHVLCTQLSTTQCRECILYSGLAVVVDGTCLTVFSSHHHTCTSTVMGMSHVVATPTELDTSCMRTRTKNWNSPAVRMNAHDVSFGGRARAGQAANPEGCLEGTQHLHAICSSAAVGRATSCSPVRDSETPRWSEPSSGVLSRDHGAALRAKHIACRLGCGVAEGTEARRLIDYTCLPGQAVLREWAKGHSEICRGMATQRGRDEGGTVRLDKKGAERAAARCAARAPRKRR